jgi:hypothetical protein
MILNYVLDLNLILMLALSLQFLFAFAFYHALNFCLESQTFCIN